MDTRELSTHGFVRPDDNKIPTEVPLYKVRSLEQRMRELEQRMSELETENACLREAARAFGDLAERLNQQLRDARRLLHR